MSVGPDQFRLGFGVRSRASNMRRREKRGGFDPSCKVDVPDMKQTFVSFAIEPKHSNQMISDRLTFLVAQLVTALGPHSSPSSVYVIVKLCWRQRDSALCRAALKWRRLYTSPDSFGGHHTSVCRCC